MSTAKISPSATAVSATIKQLSSSPNPRRAFLTTLVSTRLIGRRPRNLTRIIRSQASGTLEVCAKESVTASNKLGDCRFTQRVLLTLEEKHLPYDLKLVDLRNKPEWFLNISPEGKVPLIKLDEKWIPDSDVITQALEEKFPEPSLATPLRKLQLVQRSSSHSSDFLKAKTPVMEQSRHYSISSLIPTVIWKKNGPFCLRYNGILGLSSSPPFSCCKRFNMSSQAHSSRWVQHNELFQRHPRLQIIEAECKKSLHHLKQSLSYIFVSGLHRNPFIMSHILYSSLVESEGFDRDVISEFGVQIFSRIEKPNIFSWNTMIRFFMGFNPMIAVHYYTKMLREEMRPDKYTFPFLLQAGAGPSFDLGFVQQGHCHAVKFGFDHNLFVQNSLLNSYTVRDSAMEAQKVFEKMPERDVVTWTSLISGLVAQSNYGKAFRVFKNLLADDGEHKPQPNVVTTISAISACGGLGSIDLTKCLHAFLEKAGWMEVDVSVANSVIDAYAKCGDLSSAVRVFDIISSVKRDIYSWTAIITAYGMHGRGIDALHIFSQMEKIHGLVPDAVTLIAILSACAHSGLVKQGLCVFDSMSRSYKIKPDLRHYGCIVDLLGRAGMIKRAYNVVETMPMEPNLSVLGSLLSSCRLHNELEIGEAVLRKIELLKERGGASVLMSNMYANGDEWGKVIEIRKEMRGRMQGKKPPGRSWIQIKDAVHEFVARNDVDPQTVELHMVLESLEKLSRLS